MKKIWLRRSALVAAAMGIYGLVWAAEPRVESQDNEKKSSGQLAWVEYGEALDRAAAEDKHVLIDFYTSWCGWCKVMDRKTYTDASVMQALNDDFIIVKLNAESSKKFKVGKTTMTGRQVAREFGVSSFPMTWFLKPDGSRLVSIPGFVPAEKFMKALEYVGERQYEAQEHTQSSQE